MKIRFSHILALAILGGLSYYMYKGDVNIGGQGASAANTQSISERKEEEQNALFKVSILPLKAEAREQFLNVRGRTKAQAIIPVRSETGGILRQRHVNRGDYVNKGDLVCSIESGAREANVASAKARLLQAETTYNSNKELLKKGFTTQNQMLVMEAQMNAAQAELKSAEIELSRVEIRANASGLVQDPIAEPGDVLASGTACVTLVDSDPMFFTGQVSESVIGSIEKGMAAEIQLINGTTTQGEITYIAPSSDPQTRTFLIDVRLDGTSDIRDGLTASANIKLPGTTAFKIPPSSLTLNNEGALGIKVVDAENIVRFLPVRVIAQTSEGFWIEGPTENVRLITLGQEYVIEGEKVEAIPLGASS